MTDPTIELLQTLVQIDSVNPSLVPGGAGEAEMAAHIAGWATAAGLEVEELEETAGRPSVVVRARGTGGLGHAVPGFPGHGRLSRLPVLP